jgi:hypothetical protein
MLARVAIRSDPGGRSTATITRSYHLIEGPLIEVLDAFFNGTVLQNQKAPGLAIAPIGRGDPSLKDFLNKFVRHRVRLQPAHSTCGVENVKYVCAAVRHTMLLPEQVICTDCIS